MATEGDTSTMLRLALTIDRRGVEVVHAVFNGVVNLLVDHILIKLIAVINFRRQTHHAIA